MLAFEFSARHFGRVWFIDRRGGLQLLGNGGVENGNWQSDSFPEYGSSGPDRSRRGLRVKQQVELLQHGDDYRSVHHR